MSCFHFRPGAVAVNPTNKGTFVMPQNIVNSSGTLAAGVASRMAPKMPHCSLLMVANNGTGAMVIKFGSAPASATDGMPLDPASAAGGQGGSLVLTENSAIDAEVWGFSTAGTTFTVQQGNPNF